jgi:hypothetical protein
MNPEKQYDTRLMERLVAKGKVSRDEMDAYLKALPDSAGNAANLEAALAERATPAAAPKAETGKKGKHG